MSEGKSAESIWKEQSELDRLNLLKRVLSNPRLNGASVCYDLNLPFQGVADLKLNEGSEKWCPGPELNRHARLTEAQDFKSCASTNFATGARGAVREKNRTQHIELTRIYSRHRIYNFRLTAHDKRV